MPRAEDQLTASRRVTGIMASDGLRAENETSEMMNFDNLKRLAQAAVLDYDCLRLKYEQNLEQYEKLQRKLQETEEKLVSLQTVLEPACNEYNNLNLQLEVEKACRTEAEKFASRNYKENSKLKRQSQMLLDRLGSVHIADFATTLDVIEDEDTYMNSTELQGSAYTDKIAVLENEVKRLESKLFESETQRANAIHKEEDLTNKCKNLERELLYACKRLEDREAEMKSFSRVSQLAYEEFTEIKEKYQTQVELTRRVEEVANEFYRNNESLKRQSSLLMTSDVLGDSRLCQALTEIETLTESLEKAKHENKQITADLEIALASDRLKSLESELQLADGEVARLQKALAEMDDWKVQLIEENKNLKEKLDEITRPPPAPPCPILPVITNIAPRRMMSTTQKVQSPLNDKNDKAALMENTIQEMMMRIKNGNCLKPPSTSARRPSVDKPATESPMSELHQILNKIGKVSVGDRGVKKEGEPRTSLLRSSSQSSNAPATMPRVKRNASISLSTVSENRPKSRPSVIPDSTKF